MTAEVRLAVHADLPAVEATVQDAYRPWARIINVRPRPMDADYGRLIADGRVFAIGPAGRVGSVDGLIVLVAEEGVLLVETVAVRPALQGRRIGRRLMAFAEDRARSLRLPELRLYTNEKMTSNITLYESLGYRETGRETVRGRHIVHMRKPVA